jgi:SAM-dependent methyltransferase
MGRVRIDLVKSLNHIPVWQRSITEIARVLKPGGRFYFEEVTVQALNRWFYRTFLEHPTENRFTAEEFIAALENNEIVVGDKKQTWFFDDLVIGVGRLQKQ